MTRVVVVDDHPIVLQGARRLLEDAGRGLGCRRPAGGLPRRPAPPAPHVAVIDLAFPAASSPAWRWSAGCASGSRRPACWCSACTPTRDRRPGARRRRSRLRPQGRAGRRPGAGLRAGPRRAALPRRTARHRGRPAAGRSARSLLGTLTPRSPRPGAARGRPGLRRDRRGSVGELQDRDQCLRRPAPTPRAGDADRTDAFRGQPCGICGRFSPMCRSVSTGLATATSFRVPLSRSRDDDGG